VSSPTRRAVVLGGLGLVLAGSGTGYALVRDDKHNSGRTESSSASARGDGSGGSSQMIASRGPVQPDSSGPAPTRRTVSFYSRYRHREVQMVTLIPKGVSPKGLGVILVLHGADSDAAKMATQIAADMAKAGIRNCALVCPDGGDTYWHKRADGDDPAGMILHEVLPRAKSEGLAVGKVGVTGVSMGGYGALLLAERLGARAYGTSAPTAAALGALSPAIYASYAAARAHSTWAFDSAADFARNNLFTSVGGLRHVPSWIMCGNSDEFAAETRALRRRFATVSGHQAAGGMIPGAHVESFWDNHWPSGLQYIAARTGPRR
jgi:S-formylglutathione hydrolase FrmB